MLASTQRALVKSRRPATTPSARLPPFDLAPQELNFGLFRADGRAKPVADVWRRFGRRAALDMSPFDGPDGLAWYEGLPGTLVQAYGRWREKRSALTKVTEEV